MDANILVDNWIAAWSADDSDAFSRLYALDGRYTDVPFGITRVGRDFVRKHHQIWRAAVPDFKKISESVIIAGAKVVVETIDIGRFSGSDLGQGKIKATNRAFRARAVTILCFNDAGEIEGCTEYYDRATMPMGEPTPYDELAWEGIAA